MLFLLSVAHGGTLGPWLDDAPSAGSDTGGPIVEYLDPPACSAGGLQGGEQLPLAPDLYVRYDESHAWGTPYLIDTLHIAAETMAVLRPDADPILIGDISKKYGGYLPPHKSHQTGLDADVGIYHVGGHQLDNQFVDGYRTFDPETTWALIKAFLDTGRVEMILLDQSLIDQERKWLLENDVLSRAEVDRIFPLPGTPHMWEMEGYVRHAAAHRDHLHVRVKCTK